MGLKTRLIVSAIIEKEDSLLFGKKKSNTGPYPNTWHFVGGALEEGEHVEDAIRREIQEEAHIEVKDLVPLGFYEDIEPSKHGTPTHYIFLVFTAQYSSGTLKADDDLEHLEWIPKSKIPNLKLNKPSIHFLKKLGLST